MSNRERFEKDVFKLLRRMGVMRETVKIRAVFVAALFGVFLADVLMKG